MIPPPVNVVEEGEEEAGALPVTGSRGEPSGNLFGSPVVLAAFSTVCAFSFAATVAGEGEDHFRPFHFTIFICRHFVL